MARISVGLVLSAITLAGAVLVPVGVSAQKKSKTKPAPVSTGPTFEKDVAPVVTKYCASCHSGAMPAGGVLLTAGMSASQVQKNAAAWSRVAKNVANKHMPPEGLPMPTATQRQRMVQWIDTALTGDCKLADPGKVTLRRLNREEYNNTVRDLMGVSIRPADDFPSDDVGYGFDNIGDVLSMSPLLMEKYLSASEKVVKAAIRIPKVKTQTADMGSISVNGGGALQNGMVILGSVGTASARFKVSQAGWYRVRLKAGEQYAGNEHAKVELKLGRETLTTFELRDPISEPGFYDFPVKLGEGDYNINATFLNDFYVPASGANKAQDRNIVIAGMELIGPVDDNFVTTPFQRKLIPSTPPKDGWDLAARKALEGFASRAYRRPSLQKN